jgi:hypothetical protein
MKLHKPFPNARPIGYVIERRTTDETCVYLVEARNAWRKPYETEEPKNASMYLSRKAARQAAVRFHNVPEWQTGPVFHKGDIHIHLRAVY